VERRTLEPRAMDQASKEGKRFPVGSIWQAIPANQVAVFCTKTWQNCRAITLSVASTKKEFRMLQKEKPEAIILMPRGKQLFFQKPREAQAAKPQHFSKDDCVPVSMFS